MNRRSTMPIRWAWVLALGLFATAASLRAQCPDGSPPPCPQGRVAAAAPRLDDRTWIVLPFDNVARAADIEWLKDGSVNLLYLDMSKWRDIRVIDDERVADLVRQVPEARGARLTLESGMAVARRAGAGKLVMGDLVKSGARTRIVGKVFDVRNGQRLNTVQLEAANADSIMTAFGQLARRVLGVDPPPGVATGAVGTNSVEAYKAYVAGIAYMNRWVLDSARLQFSRALQLDSTFALAHYKQSIVYGWESPNAPDGARHADAALRLGTNLPPRERNLVVGNAHFKSRRYDEACALFDRMIRADPNDVEAWYNLGECSFHDLAVLPVDGDTTRFVFRGSYNVALKAFRKTLELDPTYHLAFQHILDALQTTIRNGCRIKPNVDPCADVQSTLQAPTRRAGDSLLQVPIPALNAAEVARARELARQEHARSANLEQALAAAQAWLASAPGETRAHTARGRILLRLGRLAAADSALRSVPAGGGMTDSEQGTFFLDRLEVALKQGDGPAARQYADRLSQFATKAGVQGGQLAAAIAQAAVGKLSYFPPALDAIIRNAPPFVMAYYRQQVRAALGLASDSLLDVEAGFSAAVTRQMGPRAAQLLVVTLAYVDPRTRNGKWPTTDTASADRRVRVASFFASGDTARFMRELAAMDSSISANDDESDVGVSLTSAIYHLAVKDTTGALAALRTFRDRRWARTPFNEQLASGLILAGLTWPRTLLLLGDLEAAAGNRADAIGAYRKFIAMWEQGDPEVQPFVARARAALARLGSS